MSGNQDWDEGDDDDAPPPPRPVSWLERTQAVNARERQQELEHQQILANRPFRSSIPSGANTVPYDPYRRPVPPIPLPPQSRNPLLGYSMYQSAQPYQPRRWCPTPPTSSSGSSSRSSSSSSSSYYDATDGESSSDYDDAVSSQSTPRSGAGRGAVGGAHFQHSDLQQRLATLGQSRYQSPARSANQSPATSRRSSSFSRSSSEERQPSLGRGRGGRGRPPFGRGYR